MANCCPKATSFFGVLQRIYTLFSSSTKRWKILLDHIPSLTLKSMSQTCWESRIESVKPLSVIINAMCMILIFGFFLFLSFLSFRISRLKMMNV